MIFRKRSLRLWAARVRGSVANPNPILSTNKAIVDSTLLLPFLIPLA